MTARELFEAVGLVDDALVEEAARPMARRAPRRWQTAAVMAACCCLAVGVAQAGGLDLLGGVAGLAMPKMGSAAPQEAKESTSAVESSAAAAAEQAENGAVPQDGMEDKAYTGGGTEEAASETAMYCPVDTAEYPLWAVCDRSGWENAELTVNAGMLMVLTDDGGAPFAGGRSLTLRADGPFTAAYAAAGGAPVPVEDAGAEATVTLPEDGETYYFCVLAGDRDILLTAFEAAE